MVFWIAVLVGALFVWLAVRTGFYETWVLLFNITISIYVSIYLAPVVISFTSGAGGRSWGTALSMLVLAGGCFAILHGLSYVFLTGQFSIPFPRLFDVLFSGVLGFAAGFLILSFAALVLATTPMAEHKIVSTLGLSPQSQRANITCIAWFCDAVHSFAGFEGGRTTRAAVQHLLEESRLKADADRPPTDANEPSAAAAADTQPPHPTPEAAAPRRGRRTIDADSLME